MLVHTYAIGVPRSSAMPRFTLIPADPETRKGNLCQEKSEEARCAGGSHTRFCEAAQNDTVKWGLHDAGHDEALVDEIIALLAPVST